MRKLLAAAVCVLLIAVASAEAAAADDPQHAKELFEQGKTYFDLGQFDKAIEAWQDGYKAKADPGFLYNIGQAYRLSGDAQKAIFFYKRFLGYSPKAPNRADIEQKIAALQKQVADGDKGRPPAPPPRQETAALPPSPPPPATPAPGPPPTAPPMVATNSPPPFSPGAPGVAPPADFVSTALPPSSALGDELAFDLGAAVGTDLWASGLPGSAQPSFAFTLTGGYTFAGAPSSALHFRLGALFGFTFLNEAMSNDSFTSLLIVPSLRIRLGASRFALQTDFGIGVLAVGGLKPTSELLSRQQALKIDGAQGMLELRPSVALDYRLGRALSLFAGPAIAYSPKRPHFYAPISRIELLLGIAVHL